MPELHEAIVKKDMKNIGLLSHSIKGSSANFRIKALQVLSSEMENRAKVNDMMFHYEKHFTQISKILEGIEIV